jgi:hypothetical protein
MRTIKFRLRKKTKYIKDDNEIKLLSDIEITAKAYFILYNDSKPWKMEIIAELKKISEPKNQIDYLRKQNIEYLKYVSDNPYLLAASGYTQKTHQHKAGLDRWIELEISKIELGMVNDKLIKSNNKISYIWENNPDKELPELFELMINKHKLIAPETTYQQFKAVFTGQQIDEMIKIKRTKKFSNALLTYFADMLFQKSNPTDYLSIAARCFDNANNLNQTKVNYFNNKNRKPKQHQLIDELIIELKNPL